jgi:hypothetical protein
MSGLDMLKENYLYVLLAVIATGVAIYLLTMFFNRENFESYKQEIQQLARESDIAKDKYAQQAVAQTTPEEQQNDVTQNVSDSAKLVTEFDDLQPDELLPNDEEADEWAKVNPKGTGSLELKNLLEAGHHIGVDTQANSLRNANLQLRSEPANPQVPISVFLNSTISPDPYRKSLEVGHDF